MTGEELVLGRSKVTSSLRSGTFTGPGLDTQMWSE